MSNPPFSTDSNYLLRLIAEILQGIAADVKAMRSVVCRPVSSEIELGTPTKEPIMAKPVQLNFPKGSKRAGPNLQWPQMASDGAVLVALDTGGNVVTGAIDPTKTTVAWACSDPAAITFTFPNPADTTQVKGTSTGKVVTGVTITATLTNNDGSTPLPPAVSQPIDIPAGPPVSTAIQLGVPA
jgi:hypothetical protein